MHVNDPDISNLNLCHEGSQRRPIQIHCAVRFRPCIDIHKVRFTFIFTIGSSGSVYLFEF